MKSPELFTQNLPRTLLIAALGVGALSGCTASDENISDAPLVTRFEYDYAGGTINGGYAGGMSWRCLEDTAYDTQNDGSASAIPQVKDADTLVIRPAGSVKDSDSLELKRVDSDHPLQPANAQSTTILESYECITTAYED